MADDHGNVDAFIFGAGGDDDINAGFIGFGNDINMSSGITPGGGAVGPDIIGADGQTIEIGHLF